MKHILTFLLLIFLFGCATNHSILPSLEGKPRIQINKEVTHQKDSNTLSKMSTF